MDFTLNKVYDELRNALGAEYALIRNAPNELEKLKKLKNVIFNVQDDFADQDFNDWLNEMKDAAYDAEDVIDIFNTEILRRRSNRRRNNHLTARFICRVNDFFSCTTNPLIFRHKIGSSVQKTLCRLADIGKEREYHLTLIGSDGGVRNQEINREPNIPYLNLDVLGRDNDLKNIIEHLIQPKNEMVLLAGMGGVGKTTLATLVYHNSQVNELFAGRKIWICVSTKNFDLKKIIKDVIDQLQIKQKQKKINGEVCQIPNEPSLEALNLILNGIYKENGNFLLVLDDVWYCENFDEKWRTMEPFIHHCKILVTTREEKIKSAMSKSFLYRVGCLPEDVCWSLFENMVSPDGIVRAELEKIGKRIVKRCKGVPLAIRVLGSMMRNNQDASDWLKVEEGNFFDATIEGENEISGILKFSYNNLPLKSRFCFVYCSIFPKDSIMQKMDLCQQWTGNGFISPDEANEIFMDLLSRCFFQDVEYDDLGNITTFKMHDLIHDLAQSIAKNQCGIMDNSNEDGFLLDRKNIRYLSIDIGEEASNIWIQMKDAQKLRTLQAFSPLIMNHQFLVDCFSKLKFLRVLICSGAYIYEVPSSIDNLKLLRYVDFSDTDIEQLPETVCNLQNLQTLKVNNCQNLKALPKKLWKLSELRHLENENLFNFKFMPVEMNKLSLLQTLSTFIVNDDGENLNELRYLNHLSGSLQLIKLANTEGVSYENGILKEKTNLKSLVLEYSMGYWDTVGQQVFNGTLEYSMEALEPHHSLKSLKISAFGGSLFPTWMSDPSRCLVKVSLHDCQNCKKLPSFEHLQNLKVLKLYKLPLVEGVDEVNGGSETKVFFPSLKELDLCRMDEFRGWPETSINMPKLRTLKIDHCPKLKHTPHIPTTLRHLSLYSCDNALLLKLFVTHDLPSSLSTLTIRDISNLRHITDDYFKNLTALRKLDIFDCDELVSFSNTAMKHLSSLQHLKISYCYNLGTLPNMKQHLSSLQRLQIYRSKKLGSLPNMKHLSSLQHLEISYCDNLGSLPDMKHLSSLQHLEISECLNLESLLISKGSLKHFKVCRCSKLNCVSIDPDCLDSLEKLEIKYCQNLVSLLPVGLKERLGDALIIEGCPGLGDWPS